jgi:hypothetical protein
MIVHVRYLLRLSFIIQSALEFAHRSRRIVGIDDSNASAKRFE